MSALFFTCNHAVSEIVHSSSTAASGKKQAAKSKEELAQEKKKELEKRLQDVSGQLNNNKKPAKKGNGFGFTVLRVPRQLRMYIDFLTKAKLLLPWRLGFISVTVTPAGH